MRFSFVFSLIYDIFPYTSILMKISFLVTLKAKYQNNQNKEGICHMFQVIEIYLAQGISKYLLTPTKKHTVFVFVIIMIPINSVRPSNATNYVRYSVSVTVILCQGSYLFLRPKNGNFTKLRQLQPFS